MSDTTSRTNRDQALYWTDDLPVCFVSGVGFSTNQIYRDDGVRREEHIFEDRSFHFKLEENIYLYGVFDGHDGTKASSFAAQRMPAELLLGQLRGKSTDEQVKHVLHQAFVSVEKGYFESIDDILAEKAKLMMHVPEGISYYEASRQYPELFKQLEAIEQELKGGTMAVVALILENKLYVANVGSSRALLCKVGKDGVLRVSQLSVDHDLSNENELQRLLQLGLDVEKIRQVGKLGDYSYTRSIGDHSVKNGHRDIELLGAANSEPMLADPEVTDGVEIDDCCSFLILMSEGLYKSLELAKPTDHVNAEIASMVASEFNLQSTLSGVAQAVVDKVVRIHHDAYLTSVGQHKEMYRKREDITLLVRNFNHPLPNAASSPSHTTGSPQNVPFAFNNMNSNQNQPNLAPLSVVIPPVYNNAGRSPPSLQVVTSHTLTNTATIMSTQRGSTLSSSNPHTYNTSSNDSTQSGENMNHPFSKQTTQKPSLPLDENGRIEAYVTFNSFYNEMNQLTEEEKKDLESELEPRPAYETIPEEGDINCDGDEYIDEIEY